jgi:uncharacterized protein (TIGR03085 family)
VTSGPDAKRVLEAERASLCDTFERLGPDAPTLCEGWTTADLAAHLVVRERNPLAGPGIVLGGPFASYTASAMEKEKAKGYEVMLATLRGGPPAYVKSTMAAVNVNENWIHHEDARRANGDAPRAEDPDVAAVLTGVVKRTGRFATRRLKPCGLALEIPAPLDRMIIVRAGHPTAVMHGAIGECVLYLAGRRDAAVVTLEGDPVAIEALRTTKLGI